MKPHCIQISPAKNGYIIQPRSEYSNMGEPSFVPTIEDLASAIAEMFGESAFATSVVQASRMTAALTAICTDAVAPKLLAIETRLNPGSETVVAKQTKVSDTEIPF